MADSAQLLRMLEPVVRPVESAPSHRPRPVPVEQQSFEALLAEAGQAQPTGEPEPAPSGDVPSEPTDQTAGQPPPRAAPSSSLHGLEQIENASLRWMIARQHSNAPEAASAGRGPAPPESSEA